MVKTKRERKVPKEMIIVIILAVVSLLGIYACCKVAGDADRQMDEWEAEK